MGLYDEAELREFEAMITAQRATESLVLDALTADAYRTVHRHLFQDVYDWAGEYRTVRIAKGGNWFCFPENIEREMDRLFRSLADEGELANLSSVAFAEKAAAFLTALNAIHPFREGNGRTQNVFLHILSGRAGHPIDFERLDSARMLEAMVAGFEGNEEPLASLIGGLIWQS